MRRKVVKRKVLYSPSYGGGWSTGGNTLETRKFLAEYKPIIDYLENGGDWQRLTKEHPLIVQLGVDFAKEFNIQYYHWRPVLLQIREVEPPYRVDEYDGWETVISQKEDDWIY